MDIILNNFHFTDGKKSDLAETRGIQEFLTAAELQITSLLLLPY